VESDFPTRSVREGDVDLLVPDVERRPGPGTRSPLPFYNPAMAVARDISVLVVRALASRPLRVLDGLAAAGALGLRIAREGGANVEVVLNDKNPRAAALVRRNIERNAIGNARVVSEDLNGHLATHHYDIVELDPFGSPVPFLDAALLSAHRGSVLAVTATDTAVLTGAKPEAAWRRYLARVRHTDAYAEVGVRVLLGYIARIAARFDKAVELLLAYAAGHFVKVHLRISEGAGRTDNALRQLGWFRFDPLTGAYAPAEEAGDPGVLGPVWSGPLAGDLLTAVRPTSITGHTAARILDGLRREASLPPFYADNNLMARRARVSPPRLARVLESLEARGFRAAPTIFQENAFKTDAPWAEVLEVYRSVEG